MDWIFKAYSDNSLRSFVKTDWPWSDIRQRWSRIYITQVGNIPTPACFQNTVDSYLYLLASQGLYHSFNTDFAWIPNLLVFRSAVSLIVEKGLKSQGPCHLPFQSGKEVGIQQKIRWNLITLKERFQKLLSGFFPLRGGLLSAKLFWAQWFSVKEGVGVSPNSVKEKIH